MHSRVFTVSKKPINKDNYLDEDSVFCALTDRDRSVDYACYIHDPAVRRDSIKWLQNSSSGIVVDPDVETIQVVDTKAFFAAKYYKFKQTLRSLQNTTLEEFASKEGILLGLGMSMWYLDNLYNAESEFYILTDDGLLTLDEFVRSESKDHNVYHIGGVYDYHF